MTEWIRSWTRSIFPHRFCNWISCISGQQFLLEFALGRWYCSVLMMCKWSEWVSEYAICYQPALLCKGLYKLQVGTYKFHTFNFVSESRPAIIQPSCFQSWKQKVQKLHVVWKWVSTGNVVFFCSPFCTNFRYKHTLQFIYLFMCFFLNDRIFKVQNIPRLYDGLLWTQE